MRAWLSKRRSRPSRSTQIESLTAEISDLRAELQSLRNRVAMRPTPWADRTTPGVTLGKDCEIADDATIFARPDRPVTIGSRTKILRGAEVLGPVTIGTATFINRDAYIRSHTTIGARVAIGPFVRIITDTHEVGDTRKRAGANAIAPVTIGDGVWICAGAVILPGVNVGEGSVVAAGAVVTSDVAPHTLVGGTPARMIRQLA